MTLSVVIPTLNEAACLPTTLQAIHREKPHEIIVVDGGSTDGTREAAQQADRVLQGPRGRAAQMNLGAAHASGDVLLFLHADCTLEAGALHAAESALGRRGVAAGCYRMRVTAPDAVYRLIDACATVRVQMSGLVYGDQGLFLERRRFERIGGFPSVRFMEDVLISRTLRRQGRVIVVPKRIFVSARRWQRHGATRQTLRNWTLTALAAGGVPPDRLAAYYPVVR